MLFVDDGEVFEWGHVLTLETKPEAISVPSNVVDIAVGNSFMLLLTQYGDVFCYGYSKDGAHGFGANKNLTTPTLLSGIAAQRISCGTSHTLIQSQDGVLFGMGSNANQQLLSTLPIVTEPTKMDILKDETINAICAGGWSSSIVLCNSGKVFLFGESLQEAKMLFDAYDAEHYGSILKMVATGSMVLFLYKKREFLPLWNANMHKQNQFVDTSFTFEGAPANQ